MNDHQAHQAGEGERQEHSPRKYYIDEGWYERRGRSLQYMIESRVAGAEPSGRKPARKRGKAAAVAPSMAGLVEIEGFVSPELPILEAVFRLLLVHQNRPLDVEQISQELAERGVGVLDARRIAPSALTRILDHDFHYGIARYAES